MLMFLIVFISSVYSINPPKNGGSIPQRYIDIFKEQQIISEHPIEKQKMDLLRPAYNQTSSFPSNYNLLVIMVDFSDKSSVYTKEQFQEHLFGLNISGSLSEYYDEISYGKFTLTGNVYGPYTSTLSESEALDNTSTFITSVFDAANTDINFSNYDSDNDGVVDGILVIYPGTGADEDGEDSGHIWPHMSILRDDTGTAYYLESFDGVSFSKYAVCPEKRRINNTSTEIRPIGVYAHEFGHILGLPDLYERSIDGGEVTSEGVGEWCLMGSGSWLGNDGDTPSHMSAWCKHKLGWIEPNVLEASSYLTYLNQDGMLEINNIEENEGEVYKIYADGYQWNDYFLLENRQLTGFDSQQNGSGLLVYHIDENQFFGVGNLFGSGSNNDDYMHKLVDVEEADGQNHLDNSVNRGDSGDSFPGSSSNTNFNNSTSPSNQNYVGGSSDVELSNIQVSNGVVKLNLSIPPRDGQVIAYDNGIGAAYGFSDTQDYSYAVQFTAPDNGYLTKLDVGLYASTNNIDVNIYRSMSASGSMYDNLFQESYNNLGSGWNTLDISSLYFSSGQTFYIVLTNKQLSFGYITDYSIDSNNSKSYIYNSSSGVFGASSIGNFCIRSRFDQDGALNIKKTDPTPVDISVSEAYPNPFNPSISLSYDVGVAQDILVGIYNVNGRLVETLVDDFHAPGKYDILWNALNKPSGVYFAQYTSSSSILKQKITLIK